MVGIGTVATDNPMLTCRMEGGRDPVRIILDPEFRVPEDARCLGQSAVVFTAKPPDTRPEITRQGTKVVRIEADSPGVLPWTSMLGHLAKMGLHAVMVEGGSHVYSSLLKSGYVDKLLLFIAPRILGGGIPLVDWGKPERIADSLKVVITKVHLLGGDILVEGALEG
jgi:diaminohydroxyphosphoribosylaminopyrimidine deaminase/5-amino-6-(5-phosphoribosylamino)uracil reductase